MRLDMRIKKKVVQFPDDVLLHDFDCLLAGGVTGEGPYSARKHPCSYSILNSLHQKESGCLPVVLKPHCQLVHHFRVFAQLLQCFSPILLRATAQQLCYLLDVH